MKELVFLSHNEQNLGKGILNEDRIKVLTKWRQQECVCIYIYMYEFVMIEYTTNVVNNNEDWNKKMNLQWTWRDNDLN